MKILVYTTTCTNRLQYICNFIFKEIYGLEYVITADAEEFKNFNGIKINYSESAICTNEFHIFPAALLFQHNIISQNITCFKFNNNKAFFKTTGIDFAFDIFAASFYLISRYEEYLPHTKDMYGRFAFENSLAYKEEFLNLPLVNIWVKDLADTIKNKFPNFLIQTPAFKFTPTYDIDIAFSFKNKGWVRNIGGFLKRPSAKRIKVLLGTATDPFDVYDSLIDLHEKFDLQPIYFFLVSKRNKKYDKNILPANKSMQVLIKKHAQNYTIGIHPSWQSGDEETLLVKEKLQLQLMCKKEIDKSRQHYIRFTLPQSFSKLLKAGISEDYSMGYGSINGFRASAATSFYWFDLENNKQTTLKLYPFCFMDTNSFYEQKIDVSAAYEEMLSYYEVCKNVNGELITIWHNHILGTDKLYKGWGDMYKKFIETIAGN